jgi:plastocyanin
MTQNTWNGASRREVLKYAASTGTVAGLGGVTAAQRSAFFQETTYELLGRVDGWQGQSPDEIAGETNPTLQLVAGQTYTITWENGDGAQHNLVIEDADGNDLESTELLDEEGETLTLEFTASEEMAEYYCAVHPQSMRGSIEVTSEQDGAGQAGDQIHPAYGFPALSDDVEPPIEPDREVELRTGMREDRPNPEFFFDPTGVCVEPGDTVRFSMVSPFHNVMAYHPGFGQARRVPENVPPISSPLFAEGAYWLYTFDEPGVYDLYCGPHAFLGMVVRVVAGEASGPGAEPVPEPSVTGGPGQPGGEGGTGNETAPGNETADNATVDGNETTANATVDDNETVGGQADNATADNETTGDGKPSDGQPLSPPMGLAASVLRDDALDPENIVEQETVSWDDIDPESKEFDERGR